MLTLMLMIALLTLTPTAKLPTADAYGRTAGADAYSKAGADAYSKAADADTALTTLRNTACVVRLLCVDACEVSAVRCCARCSEAEVRRTSRYWRRCLNLTLALH